MERKRLEEKLERIEALERRITFYEDRQQIENLLLRYALNHNQKNMHRTSRFYAFSQPDATIEIAERGSFVGEENVRMVFEGNYQIQINEGSYLMHWFTTPMIEIARDGRTAKGTWLAPGAETVVSKEGKLVAVWNFIRWAIDFYKEDGEWKFYHYRVFGDLKCDYDKGWTKDFYKWLYMGKMTGAENTLPTWNQPYNTGGFLQYAIPACPKPYDTWTDETWIFDEHPEQNRTREKRGEAG